MSIEHKGCESVGPQGVGSCWRGRQGGKSLEGRGSEHQPVSFGLVVVVARHVAAVATVSRHSAAGAKLDGSCNSFAASSWVDDVSFVVLLS